MEYVIYHPDQQTLDATGLGAQDKISLLCASYEQLVQSLPMEKRCGLVAAGNSFGIMDGGLDLAMARVHGPTLPQRIRQRIAAEYHGELPVGCAITAEVAGAVIIYAPTMQVPMLLGGTANVYYAMAAAIREGEAADCSVLYVPLLGAGAGGLHPYDAAHQMYMAIRHSREAVTEKGITWDFAAARHAAWHQMTGIPE